MENQTLLERVEPIEPTLIIAESAIEPIIRAETDVQVSTAKRYPRQLHIAIRNAETLATLDEETAASCMYALPRADKTIEGPSIRLAEIMASAWGNLRIQTQHVGLDDLFVTVRGVCWDLESNMATATEVKRRITGRNGNKFNEDMIAVTIAAASAIARRNAILSVVPRAYADRIYRKCRSVAVGDAQTLSTKRTNALQWFQKAGIPNATVFAKLGVSGEDEITLNHMALLIGLVEGIKSGEITPDEAFAIDESEEDASRTAASVASTAAKAKEKMKAKTAPAEERQPVGIREDDPIEDETTLL